MVVTDPYLIMYNYTRNITLLPSIYYVLGDMVTFYYLNLTV